MARKGECKIVIKHYLQRKCSYMMQWFTRYEKEYAQLMLYEDGSSLIEFKNDINGRVRFRYEMESCIGVYLRVQMDHARAEWPVNSNPECCFTLINRDEDKNVYLVAEESKIAHLWVWKLSQYLKVPQTVRKNNEEFSINDLIDVFNVLNEPSLISDPSSWKFLGRYLGLADNTLQKIEDFHDTIEDRLYFCLLKWIQRSDKVDEKGGPTYLILVESLKKMKKEEIAEKVFANFNQSVDDKAKDKEGSVKSLPGEISKSVPFDENEVSSPDEKSKGPEAGEKSKEPKAGEIPKGLEAGEISKGPEAGEISKGPEAGEISKGHEAGEISKGPEAGEVPESESFDEKRRLISKHLSLPRNLGNKKDPIKNLESSQPLLEEEKSDDNDDEGEAMTKSPKRERASTIAGHGRDEAYRQAVANRQKDTKLSMLLGAVSHKLRKSKIKVISEIAALSDINMSSHITVNNETPHPMMYHQCFIVRGRISGYHGLNENIPPKSKKCFSFEKYSSLSLDGCAGMIFLSATTCENTACYFVIAFRNYVKFGSLTRNKAALLILNDAKSMDKISDSQSFGKIMRNKKENPHKDIDGCYKGDVYNPPFMAASLDRSESHDFRNICFRIGMIDDPSDSKVNVTVEHPSQLG